MNLHLCFCLVVTGFVSRIQARWCEEGDVKNICDTHLHCKPSNMCHWCRCDSDAWYCTFRMCDKGGGITELCPSHQQRCTPVSDFHELGTQGSSKYLFGMHEKKWDDAEASCKSQGGHLAMVESRAEYSAIKGLMKDGPKWVKGDNLWLGASADQAKTGPWFWANGASLTADENPNWSGWPNLWKNILSQQRESEYFGWRRCLYASWGWNFDMRACPCDFEQYYLCEKQV